MKTFGNVLCLLAFCLPVGARDSIGIPQVSILLPGGKREPLEIRELTVSVEVDGWLAETIYELEVFNHTNRMQEGEFSLQLPEGATVSTWAIDIEGEMRPAVSVDKEQARNAYETIKRKMIDPGIVERQEDNRYRTRIFPLPPQGTRKIRIGFIRRLDEDGRYVLPLRHDTVIGKFHCEVRGTKHLPFFGDKRMKQSIWSGQDYRLDGELIVQAELPNMDKPVIRMNQADGDSCHFIVQGRLDAKQRSAIVKPDHQWKPLRLLWDASYSGRFRDQEKEIGELHKLWKWLGDVDVDLHVLGYGGGEKKLFQIRLGKADALEKFLRTITYDGALDLRKLEPFDGTTVLVTDGGLLSPALRPEKVFVKNFHVLSFQKPDSFLYGLGGMWADFGTDWLAELQGTAHLVRVDGMSRDDYDVWMDGDRFIVTGKVEVRDVPKIRIHTAGIRGIKLDWDQPKTVGNYWNFVRRAWAQRHLELLEKAGAVEAIRTFAKSERLASDHTSLIVLERFEDHVTYRIPPPEPEQLVRYEDALRRKTSSESGVFRYAWNEKLAWYKTDYPWVDEVFREEMNIVAVWVKSSLSAFSPEKLNTAALKPYEEWLEKARDTLKDRDTLETADGFDAWRKEMDSSLGALNELRTRAADPKKGEPVHVSVRGFVKKRGVYSSDAPNHLSEAIKQAGGVNSYGDLTRVFLYRDANRFGYNLLSSEYKEVPLRWGDMVVVENEPRYSYGDIDPFSDGGLNASAPRNQSPTFDSPIPRRRGDTGGGDSLGGGNGFSRPEVNQMAGEIIIPDLSVSNTGLTDQWRAGLNVEAAAFYSEMLRGGQGRQPMSIPMVVEIAGILFEKRKKELGEQVLSNLLELYSNPVEAARSFAYWLDEFAARERAEQVLTKLRKHVEDKGTLALVSHDLGRITGGTQHFVDVVASCSGTGEGTLTTVALTDFFANARAEVSRFPDHKPNSMPSDLRVVLTMAGGNSKPHMQEPEIVHTVWDSGAYKALGSRVYEFQVRRAWPGEYKLTSSAMNDDEPVTVRVEWFHHWGTARQTRKSLTILVEQVNSDLGSMKFEWEK